LVAHNNQSVVRNNRSEDHSNPLVVHNNQSVARNNRSRDHSNPLVAHNNQSVVRNNRSEDHSNPLVVHNNQSVARSNQSEDHSNQSEDRNNPSVVRSNPSVVRSGRNQVFVRNPFTVAAELATSVFAQDVRFSRVNLNELSVIKDPVTGVDLRQFAILSTLEDNLKSGGIKPSDGETT
jgi:hypothetical protein